jgi:LysM repeat protein
MRMVLACVAALLIAGCAHSGGGGRKANERAPAVSNGLLSSTNLTPGSVFTVKVYVIKRGDTLSAIGSRFHKSVAELRALNPTINPNRLRIGEKIRVAEDKVQ